MSKGKEAEKSIKAMSPRQTGIAVERKVNELLPPNCPGTPPKKTGRPSLYCKPVVKVLLAQLVRGLPAETAARLAGVPEETVLEWTKTRPEFKEAVKNALSYSQDKHFAVIEECEQDPKQAFRAASWVLERRFPRHFAQVKQMHHSGAVATSTQIDSPVFSLVTGHRTEADVVDVPELEDVKPDDEPNNV